MSLSNKTILITRSEEQADEFIELIQSRGGKTILFPTIKITPPDDWRECDEAIGDLNSFDGIIFTSRNAVEKFFDRLSITNTPLTTLCSLLIFAVGEKTKSTIEKYNLKCFSVPETYTAENLAESIKTIGIQNKKFLFPRGNLGRDVIIEKLTEFGAEVISVIVYKTEKAIPENLCTIEKQLLEGKIDVVTFTSPSTVKNFFSLFSEDTKNPFSKHTIFAVIGEVTAEALRKIGIEPAIIAQPSTIEGMVDMIEKYYSV